MCTFRFRTYRYFNHYWSTPESPLGQRDLRKRKISKQCLRLQELRAS